MKYLVWSIEHNAWWRQNGAGYTKNRIEAGRFTLKEALEHVRSGDYIGHEPEEAIVPET